MPCVHLSHLPLCAVILRNFQEGLEGAHLVLASMLSIPSGIITGNILDDYSSISVDLGSIVRENGCGGPQPINPG